MERILFLVSVEVVMVLAPSKNPAIIPVSPIRLPALLSRLLIFSISPSYLLFIRSKIRSSHCFSSSGLLAGTDISNQYGITKGKIKASCNQSIISETPFESKYFFRTYCESDRSFAFS